MAGLMQRAINPTLKSLWSSSSRLNSQCFSTSSILRDTRKWLWPLSYQAHLMYVGKLHGTMFLPSTFVLNTSQPLNSDLMQEAMVHLWRKMPIMRVAVGRREGYPVYYETDNVHFDYKELDAGEDPMMIIENLIKLGFPEDEETALRFRLTRAAPDAPCLMPELLREFPHQYNLIGFPNHSIFDGISFSYTIQALIEVIDSLLQGKEIDDEVQVGKFEPFDELQEKDAEIEARLKADPQRLDSLKNELLSCNQDSLLLKAFPPPGGDNPKTKYVIRFIDNHLFKQMHIACKNNGVTFNSAFMASINTAIIEFLKEAGLTDEEFPISVTNATNLRRYIAPKPYLITGQFVRSTSQLVRTKRDVRRHFWEYSRDIHRDFHRLVKSKAALEQEVVRNLSLPSVPPESVFSNPKLIREYGVSNLGDLTPIMEGNGRMIQLTGVTALTVIHSFNYTCLHQIITHRRNTSYTFSYDTNLMTEDTANMLVDKVLSLFQEFSQ